MGDAPTFERWWADLTQTGEQLTGEEHARGGWLASRAALKAEVLAVFQSPQIKQIPASERLAWAIARIEKL